MAVVRAWNGSVWEDKTKAEFSYWNGSAWVEPTDVRYWDGVTWATVFGTTGGGGGAVSLRAASTASANGASSLGTTIPASVQQDDLLVLLVAQSSNAATVFNAISGWTKQGEQRAGSAAFTIGVFTRVAQSGDANTTVTSTSVNAANYSAQVRAYSGVHATSSLDAAVGFSQLDVNATSHTAPAATVASTNAQIITVYGIPTSSGTSLSATDWTGDTDFGNEVVACSSGSGNNACVAAYDKPTPGTGSQGPFTGTTTQARRWATATIVLRPA